MAHRGIFISGVHFQNWMPVALGIALTVFVGLAEATVGDDQNPDLRWLFIFYCFNL